ncbi:TadE/TadG family type IV pilus assembly protein [Paenibacillus thailandensis]|uniref:TadE/TadG family type IV pilus assembly protein n=1 Tax=Paenibacillus thailandensis TaxID=393250 RepID=A0ABW5QXB8_9BACL
MRADVARGRLLRTQAAGGLLFGKDGAVTVFSVVVLSALLLFVSVLIDYARIAMLNKMTEDAARSGVRSVLSAYDESLYGRYGLFGRGGTDGDRILEHVTASNLERAEETGSVEEAFRLVNPSLEEAHVNASETLGHHDVFRRQVLEEMKYKAPVDFTLELAGKFVPIATAAKEAAVTVNLLEKLNKLYEERQKKLDRVLGLQLAAAQALQDSGIDRLIPYKVSELVQGGDDTAAGLAADYPEYAEWVLEDEALAERGLPRVNTEKIKEYRDRAHGLLNELKPAGTKVMNKHTKLQGEALTALEEAERLNEQMRTVHAQAEQSGATEGFDKAEGKQVTGQKQADIPASNKSDMEEIRAMGQEVILPAGWFQEYRTELSEQAAAYASLDMEIGGFGSNLAYGLDHPDPDSRLIQEGALNLRTAYDQYDRQYIRQGSKLDDRKSKLTDNAVSEELKRQREQIGEMWKQTRGFLHALTAIPQSEEHTRAFQEVQALYKDNLAFNEAVDEAEQSIEEPADADAAAEASYSLLDQMFGGIGDMLDKARDSVYFSEYAAGRFTYFAPQNLKAAVQNGDLTELTHGVALANQELEYIVYGFHDPVANLAAAYGELFAVRYAIRTMEGLSACKATGHPLLILSCSMLYGLEKTGEDMAAFAERGAAPLSKYAAFDVTYLEYLRLFLLLHGADGATKLARMSALIEHNTGAKLTAVPASVTAEVTAAADLWFIPGAIRLLGSMGLLQGRIDGGRYETTRTVGYSY